MAPEHTSKKRLLIFVIAYHAESTLRAVLERIPLQLFDDHDCEVLVVDDGSADRTFAIGDAYREGHPQIRMTVLRNQFNQGYGGNQKVGYAYAIAEGFDMVALLHGDGQYAPEALPRLLEPLCDGSADAVFGSRLLDPPGGAREMPLHKLWGNRLLKKLQNAMLGTRFSEFHCGYRVYSVAVLRRIHYRLNTNDFHFDTEITLQLLNLGARIRELPITSYAGREIRGWTALEYAGNVLWVTARNVAHRAGLLYQRHYDPISEGNAYYELKLGYPSSHTWALEAVPAGATVLDIGAGPGGLAVELAKKGCHVAVVDQFEPVERGGSIDVLVQDLDDPLAFSVQPYSHLLLLDVIEHLKDPELFLERLRRQFGYEPKTLVLTTGNVAFIVQRLMLLFGQFNYGKAGILDRTHTRLLTFRSARRLLRNAGFTLKVVRGIPAPFPKALGDTRLARLLVAVNLALNRVSKALFAYQIYIEAESTPDVDFVLADTRARSAAGLPAGPVPDGIVVAPSSGGSARGRQARKAGA